MDRSPPRDPLPPAQFVAPTPRPAAPPRPPRLRAYLPLVLCNLAAGLTAAGVWTATAGAVDPPRPATASQAGASEARRPPRREGPARRSPTRSAERARGATGARADGAARAEPDDGGRPSARAAPRADARDHQGRAARAEAGAAGSPPGTDPSDEGGAGAGPATAAEPLTVQVILDGVSDQVSVVEPCLQQGVIDGLLEYDVPERLVLDFVIAPSGRVEEPRVVGPEELKGSTLAACMEAAMRGWRFPRSRRGAPVRNFPFGPFTIHAPGSR